MKNRAPGRHWPAATVMLAAIRRAWAWAAAAGLAAVLFACFSFLVGAASLPLAALAGAGLAVGLHEAIRRHYRTRIERLSAQLANLGDAPSPALARQALQGEKDLAPLVAPVEALCAGYRQALAERREQAEALEALRASPGRAQLERDGARPVLRVSGSSRNMVARLTPGLHWMTATPALQQFLGRPLSELNAHPFAEVIHPDDAPWVVRGLQEALETGEAHNIAFRVLARPVSPSEALRDCRLDDGPAPAALIVRHAQMDVLTHYSDLGPPLHLRCHLVDITARVLAEQALRRRTEEVLAANGRLQRINADLERLKESYRDLYHQAPVMYFSLDAAGRFVACNGTMLRALGYGREDLFGQSYLRLLTVEEQGRGGAGPLAYHRAGELETRWQKKDGSVIDVWIRNVPVEDEQGRFIRSRSAAQDVTERNRLADELRRQRDELERANADLRHINRELDEFTRVVSHDLKEPLRTLQAYGTFLVQGYAERLGPQGAAYLDHLVGASRRLGCLIDDLLSLSLAGRVLRVPQAFDLGRTVQTVCRDLADLIGRKGATVRVAGPLPAVAGDEARVAQLLANLLGNGLKYNTSGRPEVVVGTAAGPAGAGLVTLFVRDNGIGIEPAFHEQVFGIFRRLHAQDEYEGTGAGLAICRKIVEAHGGRIWVESAPGTGSTFFFTLPEASGLPTSAESAGSPEPAGARLLLVEDMQEIGLIVQRLGRQAGHRVDWLTSAEAAWDHLQSSVHRPDLVLLDIQLPGMSGVDLCRRLRAAPDLADLTVALFSQVDHPEALAAGRDAGADFVLPKDLLSRPAVWQRRLQELLAGRRPEAAVP